MSVRKQILGATAAVGLLLLGACASDTRTAPPGEDETGGASGSGGAGGAPPRTGGTGGGGGTAGTGGRGGTGGSGGGTAADAGGGGASGAIDAAPDAARDAGPAADAAADAPRDGLSSADAARGPGWAGIPGIEDLSKVKPSAGCGKDPGQALGTWVRYTVPVVTMPMRGDGIREYFIKLPANYDRMKPYRLVFEGPGCGGSGTNVIDYARPAGSGGVIQIGLTPEPGVWYSNCFDDMRSDSIEYKFFETVYAIAHNKLCFDQNRVFASGHSSGSWLSNMLGCVYGSKLIRAIAPSSGGLASGAGKAPPCTDLPTPGIWTHNEDDTTNRFSGTRTAINRALMVNRCQGNIDTSPRAPYPVASSATASMVCERFTTCPKEFPIVLCHPKTGGHDLPSYFPAAAWQFFNEL